ncbi:MAG: hypothetical protein QXT73_00820 [Candidatus Methanomethylicaceae archaeon]
MESIDDLMREVDAIGAEVYTRARELADSSATRQLEARTGAKPGTIRNAIKKETVHTPSGPEHRIYIDPRNLGPARFVLYGTRNWRPNDLLGTAVREVLSRRGWAESE